MPDLDTYKSTLTPQQVDEALQRILKIDIPDIIHKQDLFDMVYPAGSIYMSTNNVSPQTFLGGTWQQIQGRFLLSASGSYPAGSSGGEAMHTLTEEELPHISGSADFMAGGDAWGLAVNTSGAFSASNPIYSHDTTGGTKSLSRYKTLDINFGSGKSHNNMPPYLSVYMWKRTA